MREQTVVFAPGEPVELFGGCSDDAWFALLTDGRAACPWLQEYLPGAPSNEMQEHFTGSAGIRTLREGFRFYLLVKQAYQDSRTPLNRTTKVLDFGAGWGRITRFFLREVSSANLLGVDPNSAAVEECRNSYRWGSFETIDPYPPTTLPDESLDLIYLYSVFSHLAETVHLQWVAEFHRLLRPGGIVVATTWPREYIQRCAEVRAGAAPDQEELRDLMSNSFDSEDLWLARYDAGEFCFTDRGVEHPYFGEAAVPERFVRAEWEGFDILSYSTDRALCPQNAIVAQREG